MASEWRCEEDLRSLGYKASGVSISFAAWLRASVERTGMAEVKLPVFPIEPLRQIFMKSKIDRTHI